MTDPRRPPFPLLSDPDICGEKACQELRPNSTCMRANAKRLREWEEASIRAVQVEIAEGLAAMFGDEVRDFDLERAGWLLDLPTVRDAFAAKSQRDRALRLHHRRADGSCAHCSGALYPGGPAPYPCSTARALGVDS